MQRPTIEERCGISLPEDWTETRESISLDPTKFTSFMLGLPDTIEKVTIKMGGRTVEFDVNAFMDMLESFK